MRDNTDKFARSTPFTLKVRKQTTFDFSHTPAVHTLNNPYISHLFNAVSLAAPLTEGILMRTARQVAEQVTDPGLQADLKAFIGQEAVHTREHIKLNKRLAELGYGAEEVVAKLEQHIRELEATITLQELMAAVVVGEHAVYSLAKAGMDNPKVFRGQDPEVRRLFVWHAMEEIEHQSVCHDIYMHLYGDNLTRRMLYTKLFLKSSATVYNVYFKLMNALLAAGPRPAKGDLTAFVRWAMISPALGPALTKQLLAFLMPTFKHWHKKSQDLALIEQSWLEVYSSESINRKVA